MEYIHHYMSPLGGITIASDGEALTGLWFDGQKYFASSLSDKYEEKLLPVFCIPVKKDCKGFINCFIEMKGCLWYYVD